ncbi:MAG: RNA-binding protein, partial [Phenylobacterium sp.]|nr:RNA-binding protein [Phenylobacterium sp.]
MTASTVPTTLAQVARERRDIVTGEVMAEERLIRFVAGPGGVVVPDLARKLPGRGMWVAADRASVETAARKGLFSRSAKAKLSASPDHADQVDSLLRRRVLDGLGLAKRAGDLISGYEQVAAALNAGRAAWVIEAADGAQDGRRKIL